MGLNRNYTITFNKVIKGKSSKYYMYISTTDISPTIGNGVTLLLRGGHRITKPYTKVDTRVNDSAEYVVSAFLTLNAADIALLTKYYITDFKLYVSTDQVDDGAKYLSLLNCLVKLH